ncbi:MAG: LysM peptidoglycan-binding domain-containing protein [Anaerolineales bacterium]|nr:LysM peptidoglycan-binding domain-containing protein [Anaerolineales bacterium]
MNKRMWNLWGRPSYFVGLVVVGLLAIGCSSEPQTVEVTRIVNQDVPVTVEVAQVVTVEVPVEVTVAMPVEVTRLVEVMVTPTEVPTEAAAEPTATPEPTAVSAGNTYTVQSGDTLASISFRTGVAANDILAANGLNDQNFLRAGQELIIPGWDGTLAAAPTSVASEAAPATAVPGAPPAPAVGQNLLPNPSFEEDWYFFNGINELQLPIHWSAFTDEGPNTLTDDPNDLFLRPEIRVITTADLPDAERAQFVFNGNKTIKAFKGHGPTSFGIFTDIALPAGSYRFTARYFPDTVLDYNGNQKVWNTDPQAAEVRIIFNNGGTGWSGTTVATRNTMTYDFTLDAPATVRLGAAFRNRYINNNNSWFIDDWSLVKLED